MSGEVEEGSFIQSFVVTKYNPDGIIDWEKIYNPTNGNGSNGIIIKTTAANELIVYLVPEGFGPQSVKLKKYDASGALLWEFEKPVINANLYALFTDDAGNVYLGGSVLENESATSPVFMTMKVSPDGDELWTDYATTDDPNDNICALNAGKVAADGSVILVGASGQGSFFSSSTDITVLKYAAGGTLDWMHYVPVAGHNSAAQDLLFDASGNIYVNGAAQDADSFVEKTALAKLDASGTPLWTSLHEEPGRHSQSYTLKQLTTGEIVVSAFSVVYGVDNKVIAVKFDPDGNEIWAKDTELYHYYRDMSVDAADNVYVLSQVYTDAFPYRLFYGAGPFYAGDLKRIDAGGGETDEWFLGPELSTFNPVNFLPMPDGRLLIPGSLEHETTVFQGHYFFQSEYNLLDVDTPENPQANSDWLGQNYPNPARGLTQIPFYSENGGTVAIRLYDMTGKYIGDVANGDFSPGQNTVSLDVSGIQSGMYFYQLVSGNFKQTRKLIIN
jgi:hypothetical protein